MHFRATRRGLSVRAAIEGSAWLAILADAKGTVLRGQDGELRRIDHTDPESGGTVRFAILDEGRAVLDYCTVDVA